MIKWKILKQFICICLCIVYDFAVFGEMPTDFVSKIKSYLYKWTYFVQGQSVSCVRKKEHIILIVWTGRNVRG